MIRGVFLMLCTVSGLTVFGQQSSQVIGMTVDTIANPFMFSRTRTNLAADPVHYKNLPGGIADFRIKKMGLGPGLDSLNIFYGITKEGKRLVIFDTDFDHDLAGEYTYFFDKEIPPYTKQLEQKILASIPMVAIKYRSLPAIYLRPVILNCCARYATKQDSAWHLFVEAPFYWKGNFKADGNDYTVAMDGATGIKRDDYRFFIVRANDTIMKESGSNPSYKKNKTIAVENREFVVDSVGEYADKIWITDNGEQEKTYGSREGQFARNIISATLQGRSFNLFSLREGYVLLDFWGTWCVPCITLIPRLKALHEKYKRNGFNIVSIAYDKEEDLSKLKKLIEEKGMDWSHLFSNMTSPDNLSKQYEVNCYPTSILINKEGRIIFRGCGEKDFDGLEKILLQVLGK